MGRFVCPSRLVPRAPVHPHACGEILFIQTEGKEPSGTSPRLWGDWPEYAKHKQQLRYIPTLVGRLTWPASAIIPKPVHPHACGEIDTTASLLSILPGTSPRLWGDCKETLETIDGGRYIPTLVGRFLRSTPLAIRNTVHPHACGEIADPGWGVFTPTGTSPRLWGDCSQIHQAIQDDRYIPTLVGRFSYGSSWRYGLSVHPHACGEIVTHRRQNVAFLGTSPRLWGDCPVLGIMGIVTRYIPTLVGRLSHIAARMWRSSVHPHACGEIALCSASWVL